MNRRFGSTARAAGSRPPPVRASGNQRRTDSEVGDMKRALLTAAALSLATLSGAPACRANNPSSQPSTRPTTNPAAPRTADGRQTTGQKYQDAVRKQEQTKKALRDRVMSMSQANAGQADVPPPPTPAEQLAEAQARLDEEVARHEARLGELRREESDARYAGD